MRHGYPRDAMLARVLAMALYMSVCVRLSVTSRSSIETVEQIGLVLARELLSASPTLCCEKIRLPPKTRVLSCGTLPYTLGLENFTTIGRSRRNVLSALLDKGIDAQTVINWTVVGQLNSQHFRARTVNR